MAPESSQQSELGPTSLPDDVVVSLVEAGLARPPVVSSRAPIVYDTELLPPNLDLITELERDRRRLE